MKRKSFSIKNLCKFFGRHHASKKNDIVKKPEEVFGRVCSFMNNLPKNNLDTMATTTNAAIFNSDQNKNCTAFISFCILVVTDFVDKDNQPKTTFFFIPPPPNF